MRFLVLLIALALPHSAAAQAPGAALDALVAAYPDVLARHDGRSIVFRNGPAYRSMTASPKATPGSCAMPPSSTSFTTSIRAAI